MSIPIRTGFCRTRVKICGITRVEDAASAATAGADAIGFMFYRESRRFIKPESAAAIIRELPPFVQNIGVFVNESAAEIRRICTLCRLDGIQLHGDESPEFCDELADLRVIKAFPVRGREILTQLPQYRASAWLLDAYSPSQRGGTGESFNWDIAAEATQIGPPVILAGGLNPENVARAIHLARPYGVDVSSGVELAPGIKNPAKIRALVAEVLQADRLRTEHEPV